jgi:predicted TIM-barrel fold metal-dependent hydrolase
MSDNQRKQQMREEALAGRPVTAFEMIDAHGHLGYWFNFNIPWRWGTDMVKQMDLTGVRCIVAAAHAGIGPDYIYGNTQVIQAMREFPGRILGYCCVNPNYPADEIRDEIKRCFDSGMVAIKFHPSVHGYPADGEGYRPAWEFANEHGICVMSHSGAGDRTCGMQIFDSIATEFPNAKIVLGHAGFGYEGCKQSCELARKHANVHMDIAHSISYRGLLKKLVDGAGADRVLFGTDMPFFDSRPTIGRAAFSELTDDQLELVLAGNAKRLFGI